MWLHGQRMNYRHGKLDPVKESLLDGDGVVPGWRPGAAGEVEGGQVHRRGSAGYA
jgi:hypothetical protein